MRHLIGASMDRLDERRLAGDLLGPGTRVLTFDAEAARVLVDAGPPPRLATVPIEGVSPPEAGSLVALGTLGGRSWAARVDGAAAAAEASGAAGSTDPGIEFEMVRAAASSLPADEAGLVVYAAGLLGWHRRARFCGECGAATRVTHSGHQRVCMSAECAAVQFPRTDPAVISLVRRGDECLLINQPRWPADRFATVAGFVEPGETLEQAVAREVAEEVGLRVVATEYLSSQPWPFPHSIMIGFRSVVAEGELRLGEEVREARWFTRPALRKAIGEGQVTLPTPFSISRTLVDDWLEAG